MRLLDIKALRPEKGIAFSRPHLYRLIAKGGFPKPIRVGAHRVAFIEGEIDAWLEARVAERDGLERDAAS